MSLYSQLAENLIYVSPSFYKKRFFKKLNNLTVKNALDRGVEPELAWIKEFLPKDAVFVDVGANVGAYLYELQDYLKPENIYGFEPNMALYKRLQRLFPGMNILPFALSNKNEKATFKIPVIKGKEIATRGTLQTQLKEIGEERTINQEVVVKRFDDWAERQVLDRVDFIKIDVEGNEAFTVAGMLDTILRLKPVLMIEMEQRHHKRPIWEYIKYFERYGYDAHFLSRETYQLEPLKEIVCTNQDEMSVKDKRNYINNIIFIPKK